MGGVCCSGVYSKYTLLGSFAYLGSDLDIPLNISCYAWEVILLPITTFCSDDIYNELTYNFSVLNSDLSFITKLKIIGEQMKRSPTISSLL